MVNKKEPSSFRDNSGFLFYRDNVLYRRINRSYYENWERLTKSGLYDLLVAEGLLLSHEIVDVPDYWDESAILTIRPRLIPFISYPYEWSFSQLKDAALTTLKILDVAVKFGMTLRDASAFNIQFFNGKPILIDTLSLGTYKPGEVLGAYGQFCRHFLSPLALCVYRGLEVSTALQKQFLDGVDLPLTSGLLPIKTRCSIGLGVHIHLHSMSIQANASKKSFKKNHGSFFSEKAYRGLLSSLELCINKIKLLKSKSEWSGYYNELSYTPQAFAAKKNKVGEFLANSFRASDTVLDIGANDGEFSRMAAGIGFKVLSIDNDYRVCEMNYQKVKVNGESRILPLFVDLINPSPAIGWDNIERASFLERSRSKNPIVLALAVIHHLVIGNNTTFDQLARLFSSIGSTLIIEFVPKQDKQARRLLVVREDIFTKYSKENFENIFSIYFTIRSMFSIPDTGRILYLMERRK